MTDTNQQIDNELSKLQESFNNLKAEKEQLEAENEQLGDDLKSWINTMACLTHFLDETQGCNWKNTTGVWGKHWDGYIKKVIAISSINSVITETPNQLLPGFREALKESLNQENTEIEDNVDDQIEQFSRVQSRKLIEKLIKSFDTLKKYDKPSENDKPGGNSVKEKVDIIEKRIEQQQTLGDWARDAQNNPIYRANPNSDQEISKSLLKF